MSSVFLLFLSTVPTSTPHYTEMSIGGKRFSGR